MSAARTSYLVCYDISESPRRLARVRRRLIDVAFPVQYSVFLGTFTAAERREVIGRLARTIDARLDDVRLYPVPSAPIAVCRGRAALPAGIFADLPLVPAPARAADED